MPISTEKGEVHSFQISAIAKTSHSFETVVVFLYFS